MEIGIVGRRLGVSPVSGGPGFDHVAAVRGEREAGGYDQVLVCSERVRESCAASHDLRRWVHGRKARDAVLEVDQDEGGLWIKCCGHWGYSLRTVRTLGFDQESCAGCYVDCLITVWFGWPRAVRSRRRFCLGGSGPEPARFVLHARGRRERVARNGGGR